MVSDQIRLWQADTQRVKALPAVLYSDFETPGLWAGTVDKARELGAHLWEAPPRPAGVDLLKHQGVPCWDPSVRQSRGIRAEDAPVGDAAAACGFGPSQSSTRVQCCHRIEAVANCGKRRRRQWVRLFVLDMCSRCTIAESNPCQQGRSVHTSESTRSKENCHPLGSDHFSAESLIDQRGDSHSSCCTARSLMLVMRKVRLWTHVTQAWLQGILSPTLKSSFLLGHRAHMPSDSPSVSSCITSSTTCASMQAQMANQHSGACSSARLAGMRRCGTTSAH